MKYRPASPAIPPQTPRLNAPHLIHHLNLCSAIVSAPLSFPPATVDELIERVLEGDDDAWSQFFAQVHPICLAICRRRHLGNRLPSPEDARHDVALRTLDRLRAGDFAALRRYVETRQKYPGLGFTSWLATVVSRGFVDYVRARPEVQRRRDGGGRKLFIVPSTPLTPEMPDNRSSVRTNVEIRRIMTCLLDDGFPQSQRRALLLWLEGADAAEVAQELDLADAKEAHRLLRAARQRLRRAFATR